VFFRYTVLGNAVTQFLESFMDEFLTGRVVEGLLWWQNISVLDRGFWDGTGPASGHLAGLNKLDELEHVTADSPDEALPSCLYRMPCKRRWKIILYFGYRKRTGEMFMKTEFA